MARIRRWAGQMACVRCLAAILTLLHIGVVMLPTSIALAQDQIRILPAQNAASDVKRYALVIGNAAYRNVTALRNPGNDAMAIAQSLQRLGFEVLVARDLDRNAMHDAISRFLSRIEPGSEAVLYYAGHGVEMQGSNYLLPIDLPALGPEQERLLRVNSINLSELLQDIEQRSARVSLAIIDACRDNPFRREGTRSLGATRGLGRIEPPRGSFVIYAAGVGEQALDSLGAEDKDPHGLFTRKLLGLMSEEGLELRTMVHRLRSEVSKAASAGAHHSQMPGYYDQMLGEFFFRPKTNTSTPQTPCETVVDPSASKDAIKTANLDQAIVMCTKAVADHPNEVRLRQLLLVAQEQLAYRRAMASQERGLAEVYLTFFPMGRFVDDVRQHMASLVNAPAPSPVAVASEPKPEPALDPKELARIVQVELKRLGCDPGVPDGVWGQGSQQALTLYNRHANTKHDATAPTLAALKDIRERTGRVCPLTCRQGYRIEGETCVAIACPPGQFANAAGVCITPPRPAPAPTRQQSCFTFNGQQHCE